jgi:hypothetical protein
LTIIGRLYSARINTHSNPAKKVKIVNKKKIAEQTKKWAPKLALFAVVGVTGMAAIYAYRALKGLDFDLSFTEDLPEDYK